MSSHSRRRRPASRGAALAEVGIIISLLLIVTFSVLDFAGLFWTFLAFQNGVSQATRYAVTGNSMTGLTRDQSIRLAMRNSTPGFTIADADFTFYNVSQNSSGTGGPNDIIQVTVVHNWPLYTPGMRAFFTNATVTIRASATMKNEPYA
jgi:Flp pilus assembly protein TadG